MIFAPGARACLGLAVPGRGSLKEYIEENVFFVHKVPCTKFLSRRGGLGCLQGKIWWKNMGFLGFLGSPILDGLFFVYIFGHDFWVGNIPIPKQSMYGIFTYMYHKNKPNVGKYTSPMDDMGERMSFHGSCFFLNLTIKVFFFWGDVTTPMT